MFFSLGFIRVKFCVVHVFCCDRPNEWFLHPLNFGLAPRGVCSTQGPSTFSIVSYIVEERWEIRRQLHPKVWPGPGQHEEPCNYDAIAMVHACGAYKSLFLKGKASLILQEGSYALVQVFMGREACKLRCGVTMKSKGKSAEIGFRAKIRCA